MNMPTGSGKSLTYFALHKILGSRRMLALTSTKSLQQQLINDFEPMGLVSIAGMQNYTCNLNPKYNANHGICRFGHECALRENGCDYYDSVFVAKESSLVTTNYQYYMTLNKMSGKPPLGYFDYVVCDEAHELPLIIRDSLKIEISDNELSELDISRPRICFELKHWLKSIDRLKQEIEMQKEICKHSHVGNVYNTETIIKMDKLKSLEQKISAIEKLDEKDIYVRFESNGVFKFQFCPRDIKYRHIESLLFRGAAKIICTSATITPNTLSMIGISKKYIKYLEMPYLFPKHRSRVIYYPTVNINYKTSENDKISRVIPIVDKIISARKGRKGIIHVPSYELARMIQENSSNRDRILANTKFNSDNIVRTFVNSKEDLVVASPVLFTGYDFPYDKCRFQILPKIPFPNHKEEFFKEISKTMKNLAFYIVGQRIVQACGRGMRSEDDWCESIILDINFGWYWKQHGRMMPPWFLELIKEVRHLPPKFITKE